MSEKRKENFSADEKKAIIDLVFQNKNILEDKRNSVKNKSLRQEKWKLIAQKISAMGIKRDWKEVRGAYQRWKMQAKKNFTAHKKSLRATGGGPHESELSPFDDMLREIVPQDFEEDENTFDSDAMIPTNNLQNEEEGNIKIYILDPITGNLTEEQSEKVIEESRSTNIHHSKPCSSTEEIVPAKRKKKEMSTFEQELFNLYKEKFHVENERNKTEHELKIRCLEVEHIKTTELIEEKNKVQQLKLKILKVELGKKLETLNNQCSFIND